MPTGGGTGGSPGGKIGKDGWLEDVPDDRPLAVLRAEEAEHAAEPLDDMGAPPTLVSGIAPASYINKRGEVVGGEPVKWRP